MAPAIGRSKVRTGSGPHDSLIGVWCHREHTFVVRFFVLPFTGEPEMNEHMKPCALHDRTDIGVIAEALRQAPKWLQGVRV